MSFPLFKLPYLALKEVFLQMRVLHVVDLSFCSQKSQRIVSKLAHRQYHAAVQADWISCFMEVPRRNFKDLYGIFKPLSRNTSSEETQTRTINNVKMPFKTSQMILWENPVEGCLIFSGYFFTLFGNEAIRKIQLRIETETDLVLIVEWLQKWKPIIRSFEVIWESEYVRVQTKLVESLLQNLNVTEDLKLRIPCRECVISRKLLSKSLELQSNCTFDSLLNVDSEDVKIGGISSLDLNKFLLNWKNGAFQKLKKLEAIFTLDWAVLTNGVTRKRFRHIQTFMHFSLENINGVKAAIKIIPADQAIDSNATRTVDEQLSLQKTVEDQSKLLAGYEEQERVWETVKKELKRITKKLRKRTEKIEVAGDASGTKEECLQLLTKMEGIFGIKKWRWYKYCDWKFWIPYVVGVCSSFTIVLSQFNHMTTHHFFPFAVIYASASFGFSTMSSVICDTHDYLERWVPFRQSQLPKHRTMLKTDRALADNQEASTGDSPYWELSKYAVLFTFGIIVAKAPGFHVDTEKYAKLFFAGFFVLSVIVFCYFHGYGINIDDKIILILIGCLGLGAKAFNQYDLRCKMIPVAPRPVAV
ncbi:hypothetical protein CAEBREN_24725 [Caenorhabditis brenneri]|uniref:F-box domain-containing protein n=1 Tax=Caenorhabditis brenneri TaxID=135651 RepID=G0MPE1_CAEBE|nr:hypothetical protein CAEBREN_24725 [Caenorhabditis brenneri]